MTTKTIKTILFASLIAAMILPFSGMQIAEANIDDGLPLDTSAYKELTMPKNQENVGKKAYGILNAMEKVSNDKAREALEKQLEDMTDEMLEAGIVPADWYESDKEYWNERRASALSKEVDNSAEIKPVSYITSVSHNDFRVTLYQTYWCYWGLLNCSTNESSSDTDTPYSEGTYAVLPSYATYGNLEAHHKIKKLTSGSDTVSTTNYLNVKYNGSWVHTCNGSYDAWLSGIGAIKTLNYCPNNNSNPGTQVWATVYGS